MTGHRMRSDAEQNSERGNGFHAKNLQSAGQRSWKAGPWMDLNYAKMGLMESKN